MRNLKFFVYTKQRAWMFPMQAQLSSHRKIKCSIEIQLLHRVGRGTPYVKYKL